MPLLQKPVLLLLFFFFLAGRSQSNSFQPTILPSPASPNFRMQIESLTKLRIFKERSETPSLKIIFLGDIKPIGYGLDDGIRKKRAGFVFLELCLI